MLWWLKIWMMYLSFVHQLSHPSVGTCALGTFSSEDSYRSTSYINSSWSNTLGKEYDPKNNHKEKCVMKGHGSGAGDIGQKSSKNRDPEIKEPAAWGTFFGFDSRKEEATPSPAPARSRLLHLPLTPHLRNWGGGSKGSMFFSPGSWLPLKSWWKVYLNNTLKHVKITNILENCTLLLYS